MKKLISKFFILIFIISIGVLGVAHQVLADGYTDGITFGSTLSIIKRSQTSVTIQSTITYKPSSTTVTTVPNNSNYRDIRFRYGIPGEFNCSVVGGIGGDYKEVKLNTSSATINYNQPFTIQAVVSNLDPNTTYDGCFMETTTTPDSYGVKQKFWTDKVNFYTNPLNSTDKGVVISDLTSSGFKAVWKMFYSNDSQTFKPIPGQSLYAQAFDASTGVLKQEKQITVSGYNNQLVPQEAVFTGLDANKKYNISLNEKVRGVQSEKFDVTTKASTGTGTGTGTGTVSTKFAIGNTVKVTATTLNVRSTPNGTSTGTQAKDATGTVVDGPTAAGGYNWWKIDYSSGTDGWSIENSLEKCATSTTCSSSGTGTGTGTPPPNTASALTRFNATSITYPATSIAGALTPEITTNSSNPNAHTLTLTGEITYSQAVGNPNIANISRMGKLIFRLTDGNNRAAGEQIVQIGGGTTLEYDVPYRFSATFGSYDRGTLNGAPATLPAPFKLQIIEDGLNARTGQLTVVNPPLVTIRGVDEPKNSTATGANGVSVTFDFTKGLVEETQKTVTLEGKLTYSRVLTGNEQADKVGEIMATFYDAVGVNNKTSPLRITRLDTAGKTIDVALTLDNIDPTKTIKFIVKDNDFKVSSDLFTLDRQVPVTNSQLAALYAAKSATLNGTTVTLTDPVITPGPTPASTVVATATIKYENPDKQNTVDVADAKVVAKLFSIDSQGMLVDNNGTTQVTFTPKYNQSATITANISNLETNKRYAVQLKEVNYDPATSSAKVIESKDGKFVEATNQPGGGSGGNNQNPAAPSGGRGTLGSPLKDGLNSIPGIVGILVDDIVIPIAVPLLALAIMYTGFLFVKAKGNVTALEEAKKALKWTLIGGAIILASKVISLALQSTIADIVRNP